MMRNCQYLNGARNLTKMYCVGKTFHSDTPDIRRHFDWIPVRRLTYLRHNFFELRKVGSTKPRSLQLEVGNGLKVLSLCGWMKHITHRNNACALRLTSSAGTGCTVPSSNSRARRLASTNQSSAISFSDGASRLSNNFCANSALSFSDRCRASSSICFSFICSSYSNLFCS